MYILVNKKLALLEMTPYKTDKTKIQQLQAYIFILFSEPEINPRLAKMQKSAKYKNPVSLLNEWYPPPDNPVYECTPSNTGHPNRTIYEMKCTLEG